MTSSRLIEAENARQAWGAAVGALLLARDHRLTNLVVRIGDPAAVDPAFIRALDVTMRGQPVRSVARTIMPFSVSSAQDWTHRTQRILGKLPHGSYFKRMVDYDGDVGSVNQIANAIEALSRTTTQGNRWVDPIPILLDLPGRSAPAHVGFPCLSLVQFHRVEDRLDATAVYRSHYYHDKAYGNFIGLGRLQQLVARESGLAVGELTVVSTDARLHKIAAMKRILAGQG